MPDFTALSLCSVQRDVVTALKRWAPGMLTCYKYMDDYALVLSDGISRWDSVSRPSFQEDD